MTHTEFLDKLLYWARSKDSVKMLIQTGSHVRNDDTADDLSDFDIEIFVDNIGSYANSDEWIKEIYEMWVCLPLTNSVGDPTRLVIYKGGIKVDFTLNRVQDFDKLVKEQDQSDLFSRGYKVLLDKDNLASKLKPAPFKHIPSEKPTQKEFAALVEEFFFEAYHVAKYLKRGSLWAVKFRDWTTKELLLRTIEWYEKSIHGWDYDTWFMGQKMEKWIEKDLYQELHNTFARFDGEDSWNALEATVKLFRKIAKATSKNLNYSYPEEIDNNLTEYINSLKNLK